MDYLLWIFVIIALILSVVSLILAMVAVSAISNERSARIAADQEFEKVNTRKKPKKY